MPEITHADVVAANMRNAFFDAVPPKHLFNPNDNQYERFDAQILESCYQKLDTMSPEDTETFYQCLTAGCEIQYNAADDSFSLIV